MRPTPTATVPPVKRKETPELMCQTREYQFITPLYGGGVDPANADPVTVVRATEIRGHLRFWWRATQGGRFDGSLKDMKKAEDDLWGAAGGDGVIQPSKVQVQIQCLYQGKPFSAYDRRGNRVRIGDLNSVFSYAAFPLRDQGNHDLPSEIRFKLTITFPTAKQAEVEAALWGWETFGGLGARTRRGFGALCLLKIDNRDYTPPNANQLIQSLTTAMEKHVVSGLWPINVPFIDKKSFSNHIKITLLQPTSVKAWEYLISKLKTFRQIRTFNPMKNRPGRNHWPEPDEIRRMTGRSHNDHKVPITELRKFPRAVFGLPIIFKFKDDNNGDPKQTSLQGNNFERLASPLILRPLNCADGKAVGLAFILSGPREPEGGLFLEGGPLNQDIQSSLEKSELIRPKNAKLRDQLENQTDVLLAFLIFLTKQ